VPPVVVVLPVVVELELLSGSLLSFFLHAKGINNVRVKIGIMIDVFMLLFLTKL
jgi:hypothetical protein